MLQTLEYFFTFSFIVAEHQVPAAVNGCKGAKELYLKNMMVNGK